MIAKLVFTYFWLIGLLILVSCGNQNSTNNETVERQRQQIDSLSTLLKEKHMEERAPSSNTIKQLVPVERPIKQNKYVIAKLTCQVLVPEYKKVESKSPNLPEGPLPDINTLRAGDLLREQREGNFHEIVYVPRTFNWYSGIEEVEEFNQDKKYRFLDKAVSSLRMKNQNLQKILKRECLMFNSYSEASEYLERVEMEK